jgi:mono/diheme cytochrome c family protein
MRHGLIRFVALLALDAGSGARAQHADIDNGRRIAERSCAACHRIDMSAGKAGRAIAFATIAAKPGMSAEIVASFLLMPHVTMPGLPLGHNDARDVAAFVMSQKK